MSSIVHSPPIRLLIFATLGIVSALSAWLLVARALPTAPELHTEPFYVSRPNHAPVAVTEAKPLWLPYPFADFDLLADLEVPEGGAVDIVLRKVDPVRRGAEGMALFHGRFTALRVSADGGRGPAFRTREQALFEPGFAHGQDVAAGLPASVRIEARGRMLRANIAGVWHGPFEATDAHGGVAFVTHGGPAQVRGLRIDPVAEPVHLLPVGWCALAGAVVGMLVGVVVGLRRRGYAGAISLVALPIAAFAGAAAVLGFELPEAVPDPRAIVAVALSGSGLALALAGRLRVGLGALGLLVMIAAWDVTVRIEQPRLAPFEDPRLDEYFGALSGSAPFDALARQMRARTAVSTVDARGDRIVFLGGSPLFEGGVELESWIAPMVIARVTTELGRPFDAAVAPALYGNARQQLEWFRKFYLPGFRPRVIVFAIASWEGEASERAVPHPVGVSALSALWQSASAEPVPATDAERLGATLDGLAALAAEFGAGVLLVDDPDLSSPLRGVVEARARVQGFARRRIALLGDSRVAIDELGGALIELLRD